MGPGTVLGIASPVAVFVPVRVVLTLMDAPTSGSIIVGSKLEAKIMNIIWPGTVVLNSISSGLGKRVLGPTVEIAGDAARGAGQLDPVTQVAVI
jgi:hypothetical protein